MVRSVHIDAGVEAYAQGCTRLGFTLQVGFILGRPQPGGKDLLLALIPTPDCEAGPAARLDGKTHITLDADWVVEHALQLSRILIGGIHVLGMFVVAPAAVFEASSTIVAGVLRDVQSELRGSHASLVLHADATSGALTARDASGPGALKPCDHRVSALAEQMVTLQTRYALDCPLPGPMPPPYKPARRAVLADVAARLEGAVLATSEGRLLPPGAASLAEAGAAAGLTPAGPWTLALHGPGGVRAGAPGVASLRGVLDARACVGRREGVAAARDALAADVRAGVAARLAPEAPGREGGEATLGTLRRVFLALPEGPLAVAEVLRFGEGEGVALARLQEVLGGAVVAEALALDAPLEVTRYVPGQALRESRNEYAMRNLIIASVLLMIIFVLYMTYFHGR
ncbi:hypothetical protein ACKKBG_A02285 [Auxenochlorella protothecoides x Auxenochlorella symbiontica]